MGIVKLNEYRVDYEDNTSQVFMAKNSRAAVNVLETDTRQVVQLSRLKAGVGVETPIRNVKFAVAVLPESAAEARCHVAPEAWVVPEGTKVIFTAMNAEGFKFDGWFAKGGTTALSKEPVTELQVDYPSDPGSLAAEFEAKFSPI
jgi:hypothetical protein